jgi:hypothetical protein
MVLHHTKLQTVLTPLIQLLWGSKSPCTIGLLESLYGKSFIRIVLRENGFSPYQTSNPHNSVNTTPIQVFRMIRYQIGHKKNTNLHKAMFYTDLYYLHHALVYRNQVFHVIVLSTKFHLTSPSMSISLRNKIIISTYHIYN